MRLAFCAAGLALSAMPAFASGGFFCSVDDKNAAFDIQAGVTRGMGGGVFAFEGTLQVKDASLRSDLKSAKFAKADLAQYWLDGSELRVLLYREPEGAAEYGSVELTVLTKAGEEATYSGRYALKIDYREKGEDRQVELDGVVECGVE